MQRFAMVLGLAFVACGSPSGTDSGIDAGTTDAGTLDASLLDAGSADAGTADAGGSDAGTGDAGGGCAFSFSGFPTPLVFADTTVGCRAERSLSVWSRCSRDVSVQPSTFGDSSFTTDGGSLILPAGTMVELPLWFAPTSAGSASGAFLLVTSAVPQQGLLGTVLRGAGQLTSARTDTWTQPARQFLDVLFVVSDGPGMAAPQQLLSQNLTSAWQYAASINLDVRGHVLLGRSDGGAPVSSNGVPNVLLGEQGQPTTSCLSRAVEALEDRSWLIDRAHFAVVCVQNTLEKPPLGSPTAWLRALRAPVFGLAQFAPGCANDDVLLGSYIDATGGARESICGSDGGVGLSSLFSLRTTFALSSPLGGDGGIAVRIDNALVPNASFTFNAARGELVFAPLMVPPPGSNLTASYEAACTP